MHSRRWSTDTHIHYYFLNLMVSDLIQAKRACTPVPFCTVQGFFKQVADVGVALSTMAIALHMLQVLVLEVEVSTKICTPYTGNNLAEHPYSGGRAEQWLNTTFMVPRSIGAGLTGSTAEQIGLDYMWMWLAAVLNIISYLFLVLVVKGVVLADGNSFRWWGKQERRSVPQAAGTSAESVKAIQMFFYPLVYIIVVLPISAARFSEFAGHKVPFAVTAFADTLFASCGLFDTILYALTRPRLMPRRRSQDPQSVLLTRITTGRLAQDRFPQDYMMEDGSFATETGRLRFHNMPDFLLSSNSPRM
ncbi:hypothetical protein EDD16DRAFT_81295 [Pisolithus croceorrhizus]|nr:hypothetical protein EDD16DRAFT_81295 [Pisolithus croceorrhizus]